jgi:transposase
MRYRFPQRILTADQREHREALVLRPSRDWEEHHEVQGNTFGFYALNHGSIVDLMPHSKKEDICCFLRAIRKADPVGRTVLILGNFRSHRARATIVQAERLDIDLVLLPPHSPDLNPIEYIWKSVGGVISDRFVKNLEDMRAIISKSFLERSSRSTFAGYWRILYQQVPRRN